MCNTLLPDEVPETPPELTQGLSADRIQPSGVNEYTEAQASAAIRGLQERKAMADEVVDIRNLFPKALALGEVARREKKRCRNDPNDEPGETSEKRKFFNRLEALDKDSDEESDLEKLDRNDRQRLGNKRDNHLEQAKVQAEIWYEEQVARMRSQRRGEHAAWQVRSAERARDEGKRPVLPDSMPSLSWSNSQVDNGGSHSLSWSDSQVDNGESQTTNVAEGGGIVLVTESFERGLEEDHSMMVESEDVAGAADEGISQQNAQAEVDLSGIAKPPHTR